MKKELKMKRIIIVFGFLFGLAGIALLSYNFVLSKVNLAYETINLELYGNEEPEEVNDEPKEEKKESNEESKQENKKTTVAQGSRIVNSNYIGYLEIPKINLKQGFVSMDSPQNTVKKNIQIIKPSNYPDVDKGNLIMAAHSGQSSISYFKTLYKLNVNDYAYIRYNGVKYTYKIVNIYKVPKNGYVQIKRDITKTTLTLITCTKGDNTAQTVYICQLESRDNI